MANCLAELKKEYRAWHLTGSALDVKFFLAMDFQCAFFGPLMTTEEQRQKNPLELTCTDAEILSRYVTDTGKILPRRITGLTALQQRHITKIIKQARNLLLMK